MGSAAARDLAVDRVALLENLRAVGKVTEKQHELRILRHGAVGDDLEFLALEREPAALRDADEKAREPVGKRVADEQQVARFQFVEQHVRPFRLGLHRGEKLQRVLLGDHIVRRGRHAAEQVKHRGRFAAAGVGGEVLIVAGRVGE